MDNATNLTENEVFKKQYIEAANDPEKATRLWNDWNRACGIKPGEMIKLEQFSQLRDWFLTFLRICKQTDAEVFKTIHKGHPYYFIGITSYFLHDYRTAVYFFDAAFQEDLNVGAEPKTNAKPSTHFLMLEGDAERQAGRKATEYAETKVRRALEYYNKITGKTKAVELTLENFRDKFIYPSLIDRAQPGLRTLVSSFIIFCVEWDYRNEHFDLEVAEKASSQPFFLHIFEGCLLFESLLRNKPDPKPVGRIRTLDDLLGEQDIKAKFGNIDFNAVKRRLNKPAQGGEYSLEDLFDYLNQYDNSVEKTMHITYVARNVLGHNIGWHKNIKQDEYQKLGFIILSSCLYAVDCLWNV